MNNEQVMKLMADNGMHEGGMDNWVPDNAWVKFAALVAAQEREACAKVCDEHGFYGVSPAAAIRARGTT
jgi:hypothetical protein